MNNNSIYKAYKTVVESQCSQQEQMPDEDAEVIKSDVLDQIAVGLKKVLDLIEVYKSDQGQAKTLKLPENPEDASWVPSLK